MSANRTVAIRILWLVLALAVILPGSILGMIAIRSVSEEWHIAEDRSQRSLSILTEHAAKVLQAAELVMVQLEREIATLGPDELRSQSWHDHLRKLAGHLTAVHSVWVVDENGQPLASSYIYPVSSGGDLRDRDYFRAQAQAVQPHFVGALLKPRFSANAPFFSLSRRLQTAAGTFRGVVTVSLLPADFERFYATLSRGEPGAHFALMRDDGSLLARFPQPAEPDAAIQPTSRLRAVLGKDPAQGMLTEERDGSGKELLLGYRRMGTWPVYAVAGYETAAIMAAARARTNSYLSFGLPAWLLIVAAVGFALYRTHEVYERDAELERTRATLQRSQKLEALGTLTGGIAHDFNNLLMVISGGIDRLLRRPHTEADRRYLDMIAEAARRGEKLTRQLLSFARRQQLSPSIIDIGERLHGLRQMLHEILRENIAVRVDAPLGRFFVAIDPLEFELAIINLATNARDAMPDGGVLSVRAGAAEDGVMIEVTDDGCGIAPEALQKIFDPFFTTKGRIGTGLGLSQVYGFCQQAGGSINVESRLGAGTTFRIRLPLARKPAQEPEPHAGGSHGHVLARTAVIVEDDPHVADICLGFCEQLGIHGYHFDDAVSALAAIDAGLAFDLVVTDILLPNRIDGVSLAAEIRRRRTDAAILLISGFTGEAAVEAAVAPLLRKPFTFEQFAAAIAELEHDLPAAAGRGAVSSQG